MKATLPLQEGCSDEIALPIVNRPNKRTFLATGAVGFMLLGTLLVTLGLVGKKTIISPSLRSVNVETVQAAEAASYNDVLALLQNQQWPDIQEILCPDGKPDTTFGPTLFALARTQLAISLPDFERAAKKQYNFTARDPERAMTHRFFHDQYQNASIYTTPQGSLAYIPIWKAANMAIRKWMETTLSKHGTIQDVGTEDLFLDDDNNYNPTCVVTAVRDPVSHFLSGYNEVEFRRQLIAERKILPTYYSMPFNTSQQRHDRFVQFVMDFVMEDAKGLHGNPFGHVFSMTRVLTEINRVGGFLSGYLPSIDHVATEFPTFIKDTCHLQEDLPPIQDSMGKHSSSMDPDGFYQAAKDVWAEQGEVARALCALHAMDYACWRNLPAGVPLLCQEVFSSPEFTAAILT